MSTRVWIRRAYDPPGRKFCTITSARFTSSRKILHPSVDRSHPRRNVAQVHVAHGFTHIRPLDFDHVGPHVGQHHGAVRPLDPHGEIQHADASKRSWHGFLLMSEKIETFSYERRTSLPRFISLRCARRQGFPGAPGVTVGGC